nr:MAG TPA: hypothetical protein [Bacteriophage sp.]
MNRDYRQMIFYNKIRKRTIRTAYVVALFVL